MNRIRSRRLSTWLLPLALFATGTSCVSTEEMNSKSGTEGPSLREPEPPKPWTSQFRAPSLLVADRVFIEGPQGLLDHFASRSEDGFHSYEAETLPEGFKQSFKVLRPGSGVELRAYLDNFEVVVFRELVVIERPGEMDVRLEASGDAYWRDTSSGDERRGPRLEFVGVIGEPSQLEDRQPEDAAGTTVSED